MRHVRWPSMARLSRHKFGIPVRCYLWFSPLGSSKGISSPASRSRTLSCHYFCVLPRCGRCATRLRHLETPDIHQRHTVAKGAPGPRRLEHCNHVGWKQERFKAPARGADRRGQGLCRCVVFTALRPLAGGSTPETYIYGAREQ